MELIEFIIPRGPVSLQAKNRKNLAKWKDYVGGIAKKVYTGAPQAEIPLHITIVYIADEHPADTDNIIKPIQDALEGIVYINDNMIVDVDSHRRPYDYPFDLLSLPLMLKQKILSKPSNNKINFNKECVYVKVSKSQRLENYL